VLIVASGFFVSTFLKRFFSKICFPNFSKEFVPILFSEFSYKLLYFNKIYVCKTFLFEQICINNLQPNFCIQIVFGYI
jgi:hypothetical protein